MLDNLKEQVKAVLRDSLESRNSDLTLTIEVWKRFYLNSTINSEGKGIMFNELYNVPREDNIKRIRAKFSEEALKRIDNGNLKYDEIYYLPTDEKVAEQRQINSAIWQKALGYFRKTVNRQTTQLPRPVGNLSFRVIDNFHFIADGGARSNKQYKISATPEGWYTCECEAYRFSCGVKTCKHIKAIMAYKKSLLMAEAAKSQKPLF